MLSHVPLFSSADVNTTEVSSGFAGKQNCGSLVQDFSSDCKAESCTRIMGEEPFEEQLQKEIKNHMSIP